MLHQTPEKEAILKVAPFNILNIHRLHEINFISTILYSICLFLPISDIRTIIACYCLRMVMLEIKRLTTGIKK